MTHRDGTSLYEADDGKMFVRISDGSIMGDGLDLGVEDTIDNYEERTFTEEERAAFWESVGMDDPKKPKERKVDCHEA
jgi:hypothetical protein